MNNKEEIINKMDIEKIVNKSFYDLGYKEKYSKEYFEELVDESFKELDFNSYTPTYDGDIYEGLINKSYSHKPHLQSLPYDLTGTPEQLQERKDELLKRWREHGDKIDEKYPQEFWDISLDMTHEANPPLDMEKGQWGFNDPNAVIEHYNRLLGVHGVIYDNVSEKYQDRINELKDNIESLKSQNKDLQKQEKELEKEYISLTDILKKYENEGIDKEDFEAIYNVDIDDIAQRVVGIENEDAMLQGQISTNKDTIKSLDVRRKKLTEAKPKKTKISKDSPYYDLLKKRELAYEFKKDIQEQWDYQGQLVKINENLGVEEIDGIGLDNGY